MSNEQVYEYTKQPQTKASRFKTKPMIAVVRISPARPLPIPPPLAPFLPPSLASCEGLPILSCGRYCTSDIA